MVDAGQCQQVLVVDVAHRVAGVVQFLHCVGVPDDDVGHQGLNVSAAVHADLSAVLSQLARGDYGGGDGSWLGALHQVSVRLIVSVGEQAWPTALRLRSGAFPP